MALPRVLSVIPVVFCALALPLAATAQTGSISGTVVFEGIAPGAYPPIRVEARDPYQGDASWPQAIGWADSDANGAFSISGLAPGPYRVYFNPAASDRAYQWYPDKVVPSGAHPVPVTDGVDWPLGTITLHPGYTIEGDVTYSGTAPDPGQISVNAQEASTGEWVSWGPLDGSHHYARTNLPAGKYILTAWTGNTGYVHELWPNSIYSSGATPIEVMASVPTATADFTLAEGRTISGHVSLAGAPLQWANVNAWIQGTACCFDMWSGTDAAGIYQIKGLPQGTYRLRVQGGLSPGGQPYTGKRYNNRSSFDPGDDLVVGGTDVENIDFSVEAAHTIEGTVCLDANDTGTCDGGEQGLSVGITVYRASDGACCEWSGSDGAGHYRIAVGTGEYRVESNPPANLLREYWQNKSFREDADVVTVASADVASIDFSLRTGASVGEGLQGRVVGVGGTGIPGVDVQVNRWSTGSGVTSMRTGPDGVFRFLNLPAGDYRIYFNTGSSNVLDDEDYISENWTRCQTEACPVGVIDPDDRKISYPAQTSLGDFQLQAGGSISGTVCVNDEGSPCAANDPEVPSGFWISLESVVSMGPGSQGPPGAQVGPDGRYRIRGIPAPVSYRVRADLGGTDFSTVYYVSTTDSTPFWSLATPVQVEVGAYQQAKDLHLVRGGWISGHVYCGPGATEAIPSMQVSVNMNGPGVWYGTGAQTDGNGYYVVRGLPPGDYQVRTDGRGQAGSAVCPNPANQTYPSMIPIVGTGGVPGVDFHLQNGATISGKVQSRVGGTLNPVVNMRVSANDWETGSYVSDAYTDSNGDYTIHAVPLGRDYRVQVNTRDGHLDPQFWNFIEEAYENDPTRWGSPVPAGEAGIDFELELGGAISGRVTAAGGSPLTGISVSASSMDGEGFWNNAQTDQNGFYVVRGLPAARYSVYADPRPRNYVPEYYDDVMGTDQWLATPVAVATNPETVEVTPNIDFELAPGATIKGRVRASGAPVHGMRLVAHQNASPWGWSGEVVTDASGEYEMVALFPGDWRVAALTLGTEYALQQQDKRVTGAGFPCTDSSGRSDCVDFDLTPGATIRIQAYEDKNGDGTCTDPVPGVSPRVQDWSTNEDVSPTGWGAYQTNADGQVTVSGLPAGSFRVRIEGQGFVTAYYDNALRSQDADPLDLASTQIRTLPFCLVRGRTISGRVFYDRNGDGVQTPSSNPALDEPGLRSVCVNARSVDGSFGYWDCTDADGSYAITGVLPVYPYPGGTPLPYRVWASAQDTPYASEYFDRVPDGSGPALGTFRRSLAEVLTVDAGDRTGIDFSLALGGGVRGTVTDDSTGAFLAGIRVYVNPFDGDADGYGATTDSSGRYLVTGLPPGGYRVQARDDRNGVYVQEYYDDTFFWNQATPVSIAARATEADTLASAADFALEEGGAIEGVVYEDRDGSKSFTAGDALLSNVNVYVEQYASPNWWVTSTNTASDGTYRLAGVPAGLALRVRANSPAGTDLIPVYYDGAANGEQGTVNPNQAAPVTIPAPGGTVSDIRFALFAGGSISGFVTDDRPSPVPLSGVNVCAEPVSSGGWFCAYTSSDGTYRIRGVLPGLYRVRAGGDPTGHRLEYYDDTIDWSAAAQIPVTGGADYPGVNFALGAGGAISGDVVDASGAPLSGITMCANPLATGLGSCDQTDYLGHYVISGLPAGSYRVTNASGAYRVEYYDNQTDSSAATPVTVTPPGETGKIDFVLVSTPRILSGPSPASGERGQTVVGVRLTIDGAAGGPCGAPPCLSVSLGSPRLHVLNPTLSGGVLTFDLQIDADAPLGRHALSVVNDYALEDASAVKTNAFEVLAQASPPVPATGDRVYVAESGTSLIRAFSSVDYSEVDAVPDDPATAIEVCCQPLDIVLSPDGQRAYVLGGDRAIGIVDLRLGREVGRIPTDTGSGFYGVAVTASRLYVADRRLNDRILVFDATTGAKVTDVMLGTAALPWGLRLHPGGRYLYVAVRGSTTIPASVTVVDTTTQTVVSTLVVPAGVSPRGFAFRPDGKSGFLQAATGTYLLNTTSPASPALVGTTPVLNTRGAGNGVIEVAPWGGRLLAHIPSGGRLWVADVTTDAPVILASLNLGLSVARVKPSSDGSKAFVLHGTSQDLYALDVAELLASPASVPASRITGILVPNALAVAPIPAAPPPGRPVVGGVSPSSVINGGADITVTVTGSRFDPDALVWLQGTMVRGTVTSAGPTGLSVTFPPTTPTGRHFVVVTNPASGESGLDPGVALDVAPPAYVHSQAVFNASFGTASLDVFESDGSRASVATQPFPAAMAVSPDGRLGLVNHTYSSPRYSTSETLPSQYQDTSLFELDPSSPMFGQVVATLPYVFGGYEPPVFTPDLANPNGVFGYVVNTISDTVSVVDPATRTEVDIDGDPATQSYPPDDIYMGAFGKKLPGLSRIPLDTEVTDGALLPQGLAITPDGDFLYVTNAGYPGDPSFPGQYARVSIVNTVTRQLVENGELTNAGNGALTDVYSIVIPPTGGRVFVTGTDGATPPAPALFIYGTGARGDEAPLDRIPLDEVPRGLAVSGDGNTVYVALRFSGVLEAIDVTSQAGGGVDGTKRNVSIGPVPSRGHAFVAVAYDDGLLYVSNNFRGEIHVLDIAADPMNPRLVTTLGARCASTLAVQPATGNPRLDSVTPPHGPAPGGNTVVLTGANFSAASQVRFGATSALTVLVDSAFRIRAETPGGTGTVDVTVENPGGATTTLPSAYTYVADTTPPVFTTPLYVASEALDGPSGSKTVTASLKWTTDEETTTRIDYSTGPLSQNLTVPGYRTAHTVELTGLIPGATYLFQATVTDLSGNFAVDPTPPLSKQLISVPDTTPPVISDVNHSVNETTATIVWHTNEDATSLVQFDGTVDGTLTSQVLVPGTRQSHSVTLTNLQRNTTYEFRVRSADASGNGPTTVLAAPPYQTFTTSCEHDPPAISDVAVSYLSNDLVIISWTTDELATSWVNYGTSSVNEQGVMDVSLVTQHIVFLTNLLPNQAYRFQAGSADACGNHAVTDNPFPSGQRLALGVQRLERSLRLGVATLPAGTTLLTTPATTGFTTPPAPDTAPPGVTTPIAVALLGPDRVRIAVGTDEAASILARYGISGVAEASAFDPTFTQTPSLILAGLRPNTTYLLEVVLTDPKGNATPPAGLSFHTPELPDTTAPVITNVAVGSVTQTGAIVSWRTAEPAESWVRFGPQGGALTGTFSASGLNTVHSITLSGLTAGTTYAFEAGSRDASGNVPASPATGTFQTAYAPPTIANLTPDRGAQGAPPLSLVVNGSRFEPNAVVGLGDDVTVNGVSVNAAGTQIVAHVTIGASAAWGSRPLRVTNPRSGLWAEAQFTIADAGAPVITIGAPVSGAELVAPSVTVSGNVSEMATVTVNGDPVTLTGSGPFAFSRALTLPSPGAHRINVTAVDPSGNRASTSIDVKYMTLTVGDAVVTEGDAGSPLALFNLSLPTTSARAITVQYATAAVTASDGTDYVGAAGTATIPAGYLSYPVAVAVIGDLVDEDDETFTLALSNASGAAILGGSATGTIRDDDGPPAISIDDVTVTEGNSGTATATFTLGLSHPSSKTVAVSYATGGGTATPGTDYTPASGTVAFEPLATTKTLVVLVKGDLVDEPDETFFVNLSNPQNATLADAQGQVTIRDDDEGGALSVNDISVVEGANGTKDAVFTVSLGVPAPSAISVKYSADPGTASPNDFTPNTGKVVFKVGQASQTLTVKVKGDTLDEDDEIFFIRLRDPQGAPIGDGEGVGTILDDDPSPSLRVNDVTVTEGNSHTRNATFVVSLSLPSGKPVSVEYATADGTAKAGVDYVNSGGVLTFAPGETSKSLDVAVKGDKVKESTETFFLNLTNPRNATIADAQGIGTIKGNRRHRRGAG